MNLKTKLKKNFMLQSLKNNNRKKPFDINKADGNVLNTKAGANLTDSHYFSGHASSGESFFFRYAERSNGTTEVWFTLKTTSGDIYVNPTQLYPSNKCPASVKCLQIGEKMAIAYHGELAKTSSGENDILSLDKIATSVQAAATFTATMPPFDFSTGLDPNFVAEALATEKWNKAFWKNLRLNRQVHYEQAGIIKLDITINQVTQTYVFPAMRDHSYGYRDWDYMNRHIWLMILFEDGEIINLNMVNYPHMHNLMTGYRSLDGVHTSLRALNPLNQLGLTGFVPSEIEVSILDKNNLPVTIKGTREFVIDYSFNDGQYHIYEGVGAYQCGDKKGRGILEFGYNANTSRWK